MKCAENLFGIEKIFLRCSIKEFFVIELSDLVVSFKSRSRLQLNFLDGGIECV